MLIGSFQESPKSGGQDPNLWTVDDVMQYIRDIDPLLAPHADLFRKHVSLSLNLDLAVCFTVFTSVRLHIDWRKILTSVPLFLLSVRYRRLTAKLCCCCAVTWWWNTWGWSLVLPSNSPFTSTSSSGLEFSVPAVSFQSKAFTTCVLTQWGRFLLCSTIRP